MVLRCVAFLLICVLALVPVHSMAQDQSDYNALKDLAGVRVSNREDFLYGMWVECEGSQRTLASPELISTMLDTLSEWGINNLFVQVYRGNRSWFDSKKADATPFKTFQEQHGVELLAYTIQEARKRGISVHAWMNMFRIARNKQAPVLTQLGPDCITRDSQGTSMLDYINGHTIPGQAGKYYKMGTPGYWLDPGHPGVKTYLLSIMEEVLARYKKLGLAGIHLDFVRYPEVVPLSTGSYFPGLGFGYSPVALEAFRRVHGFDPLEKMERKQAQEWDDWRRSQLTSFVKDASLLCTQYNLPLSCAVIPDANRAYLSMLQDWRTWLQDGYVAFMVPMSYTLDNVLFEHYLSDYVTYKDRICCGIGAYLLKKNIPPITDQFSKVSWHKEFMAAVLFQAHTVDDKGFKGYVLFSYDSMSE